MLFVRFVGLPLLARNNPWSLLLFVSTIPVSWVFVKILAIVGQVRSADVLRDFSLRSFTVPSFDRIALIRFRIGRVSNKLVYCYWLQG